MVLQAREFTGIRSMDEPNRSLDELIELMERELQRLEVSLETHLLVGKEESHADILWHRRAIAERRKALEAVRIMRAAQRRD